MRAESIPTTVYERDWKMTAQYHEPAIADLFNGIRYQGVGHDGDTSMPLLQTTGLTRSR